MVNILQTHGQEQGVLFFNSRGWVWRQTLRQRQTSLIVAGIDTLRERRELLTAKFFKRQVLANNSLLHSLLAQSTRQWHYQQSAKR